MAGAFIMAPYITRETRLGLRCSNPVTGSSCCTAQLHGFQMWVNGPIRVSALCICRISTPQLFSLLVQNIRLLVLTHQGHKHFGPRYLNLISSAFLAISMLTIGYALVAVLAQLIHVSLAAEAHNRTDASSSLRLGAGWIRGEKANLSLPVTLEFLLLMPAEVMRQASDALRAASDPASETFGQYWTRNQVTEHFSSSINIQGLLSEFTAMGLPRRRITISLSRSRAYLNTSVAEAEELFNARYYHYVNGDTVQLFSESLHFPEPLSSYVDFVLPSQWKPTKRKPDIRRDRLAGTTEMQIQQSQLDCSKYITPGCLRDIYNITHSGRFSAHPNSSLGIYEPAWATWLADDLDEFFTRFEPSIVGKRPIVQAINGGYLQTDVRGEGLNLEPNLDFQFSLPLAHPVPVTNIQVFFLSPARPTPSANED